MKHVPRDQPCPHCGRFATRAMTIDALIVKDNRILLIERGGDTFKGYWALPGGYMDWDEDITGSVKREIREELNVEAQIIRLLGVYSHPSRSPHQSVNVAFEVAITGEPTPGDDAVGCKWFDLDSLPKELAFDHAQIIKDFKSGNAGPYF